MTDKAFRHILQRNHIFWTETVARRGFSYPLTVALMMVGYALVVTGLGVLFQALFRVDSALMTGVLFFIFALGVMPLQKRLEAAVENGFFRGRRNSTLGLERFSSELTNAVSLDEALQVLRGFVTGAFGPNAYHIYLYDPYNQVYSASVDDHGKPSSDLRFSSDSPLVKHLSTSRRPVRIGQVEELPQPLSSELARLALLQVCILVPMNGRQRLAGWLSLGERSAGEPYSRRDLEALEVLGSQAALAIERLQVLVSMENRVRELNVLARIAQGVNITLAMDDILELIYAQTTQVIPADDFHLVLFNNETHAFIETFCVEKNERLIERERKPAPVTQIFERRVARENRKMLVSDAAHEAAAAGVRDFDQEIISWMGVPLNARAAVIGVLSLASRDENLSYSNDQLHLLQAIADQAAGAIVKARLLQESETRTYQLTALNEVTRRLTSYLQMEPLLQSIIESAIEITNCRSGCLYLMGKSTQEFICQAIAGYDVTTQPGDGLGGDDVTAWRAVDEHRAITGDLAVKHGENSPSQQNYRLVVPLLANQEVTGLIEVSRRRDGTPFDENDLNLLSTFSAQASISIENARLYTMTDRALADRLEELSNLQLLDRDLKTSLDTARTAQITLDWAIRQSGSTAGMVVLLQDDSLTVWAANGYVGKWPPLQGQSIPLDNYYLREMIEGGVSCVLTQADQAFSPLLEGADWQAIILLRREARTTGLLVLEGPKSASLDEETYQFLLRLAEHASIAIANAQLYAAVQAANVAKSEFVSFVSHELKNPMTSIKGYSELIAAGAVGPINEAQANFLATIRSNVERMAALVSDLADVSRIEAGRLKLDFKPVQVDELVNEVARSMRRQLDEKKQRLEIDIPAGLPGVWADRTRLAQVLTNLLSNASKYTPPDGVIRISAEASENRWDQVGAPQVVHLQVVDNGIGISYDDQKKIFQKFFRSEDPKAREAPGTGLGLNITRSLVEFQGGKIWFKSEFRKGTAFHFTIPISA